jgi:2,3-bisphosphoglycerate-independent phosphoglycerate mutase
LEAVKAAGGVALVTADHGNADEMYAHNKKGKIAYTADGQPERKTSHTLNPVPFYLYDPVGSARYEIAKREGAGLANVAATILDFLGFVAPAGYAPSLVRRQESESP